MFSQRVNTKSERQKRYVELSVSSLILWCIGLLVLLGWIFVLGILVGRGYIIDGLIPIKELKDQMAKLQDTLNREDSSTLELAKEVDIDPELSFHEMLSAQKEEVASNRIAAAQEASDIKESTAKTEAEKRTNTEPSGNTTSLMQKEKESVTPQKPDKLIQPLISDSIYTLQIASFTTEDRASKLTTQLADKGYQAYYYYTEINGKPYYRVRCGSFRSKEEADRFKSQFVKRTGNEGIIIKAEE